MAENLAPNGYHTVTPYLVVKDVPQLIDFLQKVFDAKITEQVKRKDGTTTHAEVKIADSVIMMGQPQDDSRVLSSMLYVYVKDADVTYQKALSAGATSVAEPADQFYGDRSAGVKGPLGNFWYIATKKEEVSKEELQRRMQEMEAQSQ